MACFTLFVDIVQVFYRVFPIKLIFLILTQSGYFLAAQTHLLPQQWLFIHGLMIMAMISLTFSVLFLLFSVSLFASCAYQSVQGLLSPLCHRVISDGPRYTDSFRFPRILSD